MENIEQVLSRLSNIENILQHLAQHKNAKFAFIHEQSNELWSIFDVSEFLDVRISDVLLLKTQPNFPLPILSSADKFSEKWRSGAIVRWIKQQEFDGETLKIL